MGKKYLIFLIASNFFTLFSYFCFSSDTNDVVIVLEETENYENEHSFFDENLTSTIDSNDDSKDEINIAELDLDVLEKLGEQENELSFSEKLKLVWLVFKFKSGAHIRKNGKWYLCCLILAGAVTTIYFKFIKKD